MLSVESPGVLTMVQDLGRVGSISLGIPPAGAADRRAHCVANWLVGNDADDASLEVTLQGPRLVVENADLLIAMCGGDAQMKVNGKELPAWTTHLVGSGDVIEIGTMKHQLRGYLAVSGGIRTRKVMGSRSTYLLGRMGGFEGRQLRRGDRLPTGGVEPVLHSTSLETYRGLRVAEQLRPSHSPELEVAFVVGLFAHYLTERSLEDLTSEPWRIKNESNRVGYRLEGPKLSFRRTKGSFGAGSDPSNVVDGGYPLGSLMVPAGEEGILGMWEAPTAGGFATVGAVVRSELDRLAQARPGQTVRFRPVSIVEAREVRAAAKEALNRVARPFWSLGADRKPLATVGGNGMNGHAETLGNQRGAEGGLRSR
jgi:biotin-dependent carboxylase-like uncharacterized protein